MRRRLTFRQSIIHAFTNEGGYIVGISAIIAAIGVGVAAYGQYSSAEAQSQAGKYNAKLAENQAIAARNAAEVEARQRRERYDRINATNRANIGASGVTEQGSPLLVMADNAAQAEMDLALVKYQGELGAQNYQAEADLRRFGAGSAARAGYIGAGSTLLSGAASIGRTYYGGRTPSAVESY